MSKQSISDDTLKKDDNLNTSEEHIKSISDELDRVLFKLRTTHEIEHNDNQWTTEFVYPLDEAKQAIGDLIDKQIKEVREKTLKQVDEVFSTMHQKTEGGGFVHYGEFGEWIDEQLKELEGDKE